MKNPYIIPSLIIAAAILGGFWMLKPSSEPQKVILVTSPAPDISIHKAAKEGNIGAVKQHIAAGTDVNAKSNEGARPLQYAAVYGYKEIVELLIDKGADVNAKNKYGATTLHLAAISVLRHSSIKSHKEIVGLLIANGADVNAKTDAGDTPLHYAAPMGHKEIVELLIANDADVNAKNDDGKPPLDSASESVLLTSIVDLLRKHGGKTKKELEAAGK